MEIDDMYTPHYGDYTFDIAKFPSPTTMLSTLHEASFTVTCWVMPFCSEDATNFEEGVEKGYFVLTKDGGQTPGTVLLSIMYV